MMPTVRISDANWTRLKAHARPLEDTVDDVVGRALDALEKENPVKKVVHEVKLKTTGKTVAEMAKLPQKEFRIPLLEALIELGNEAPAQKVRELMEKKMAPLLGPGDYENVSSGDPRWWNAICWTRNDLVKEGLMRSDTARGVWGIADKGTLVLMKIANAKKK